MQILNGPIQVCKNFNIVTTNYHFYNNPPELSFGQGGDETENKDGENREIHFADLCRRLLSVIRQMSKIVREVMLWLLAV